MTHCPRTLPAGRMPGGRARARRQALAMKVLVLGSGVIGVTAAYELAGAGHEVVVVDRQAGPALETSFANAGEVSPGYSAPWAGPGRAAQGDQVAADAPPAAGHPRRTSTARCSRWGLAMLRNCTAARYESTRPHGAAGRVQPRLPARAARGDRHRLRRAHAGHAAALSHPEAARRQRQRHRRAARSGVAFELLDRAGCIAPRAGAGAGAREVRRRPAPARRRDRRLLQVHAAPRRAGRRARRRVPLRTPRRGARSAAASGSPASRPDASEGSIADAYVVALGSYSPLLLDRSAFASRSTRSRATRSPCRSPMPPARPSRP